MSVVRTLGRHASFWVAAAVVAHTLWASAAPAMTYPPYASEWNLTHKDLYRTFFQERPSLLAVA
jgi:hypothetical protein